MNRSTVRLLAIVAGIWLAAFAIVMSCSSMFNQAESRSPDRPVTLWGDGLHDDTLALHELADHPDRVYWPNLQPVDSMGALGRKVALRNRTFRVSGPTGWTEVTLTLWLLDGYYLAGPIHLVH
jgi:hypothetical protein